MEVAEAPEVAALEARIAANPYDDAALLEVIQLLRGGGGGG